MRRINICIIIMICRIGIMRDGIRWQECLELHDSFQMLLVPKGKVFKKHILKCPLILIIFLKTR